jgi:sugar-specific transcriptional regulator TrmB
MNSELLPFLGKMGLTEYEAKTLATLFSLGEAEAPEVSRIAEVPKTRVYDVLEKLADQELVIRTFSRPKKYRALSPQEAFDKLVQQKNSELQSLHSEAKDLTERLSSNAKSGQTDEEKVMKVKSKTDFYKILAHEIEQAQHEVVGISQIDVHHHVLHDALRKAGEKNVSVKFAGTHHPSFREMHAQLGNHIELREKPSNVHAYVIDGQKTVLLLSDMRKDKPEYHFAIFPQNKEMAQTFTAQFAKQWNA